MKQKLNRKDKLLIILKAAGEVSITFLDECMDLFRYKRTRRLSDDNVLDILQRTYYLLKKDGLAEEYEKNGEKFVRLTIKGENRINWQKPLPKRRITKWDQKWYLVVFDVPEEVRASRRNLRDKLYEMGFRQLQKSVFISPYNWLKEVRDLAEKNEMSKFLRLMVIEKIDNEKEIVEQVWDLKFLSRRYREFINLVKKKFKNFQQGKIEYWPIIAKELELRYLVILKDDPELPRKFLPRDWPRTEAEKIYQKYCLKYPKSFCQLLNVRSDKQKLDMKLKNKSCQKDRKRI